MTDAPENALDSAAQPGPAVWKPALKEAAWAFLAAAILLVIVYALAFKHIHPEFVRFMGQDAKPLTATGKDFIPVSVGKGRKAGTRYIVEDFNGDEAILALPRAFRAEDYPFIKVNLSGFTRYSKAKILWEKTDEPGSIHGRTLTRIKDGLGQIDMASSGEAYQGQINSLAILIYRGKEDNIDPNDAKEIRLGRIELWPWSAERFAEQLFLDLVAPQLMNHSSINFVTRISNSTVTTLHYSLLALVLFGSIGLILYHLLVLVTTREKKSQSVQSNQCLRAITCLMLIAWASLDLLMWPSHLEQANDAVERYEGKTRREKIESSNIRCERRFRQSTCGQHLLPHL